MKLQTHEYSVTHLSVVLPENLRTQEIIHDLQRVAVDEYARLRDGIEVPYDSLAELANNEDGEIDDTLLQLANYLLKYFPRVDAFIFTP
jgi:hypothetical protein